MDIIGGQKNNILIWKMYNLKKNSDRFTTIKRNYSLQALIYVIYSCSRSSLLYTYMYSSIQRKPGDKVQYAIV